MELHPLYTFICNYLIHALATHYWHQILLSALFYQLVMLYGDKEISQNWLR